MYTFVEATIFSPTTTGPMFICPHVGKFPLPGCQGFVQCLDEPGGDGYVKTIHECSSGKLFSPEAGHCVDPQYAPPECQHTTSEVPTTTAIPISTPSTIDCDHPPTCTEVGKIPHPCDCKKYYICVETGPGEEELYPVPGECPGLLLFSRRLKICTIDINVPECHYPKPTTGIYEILHTNFSMPVFGIGVLNTDQKFLCLLEKNIN